MTGATFVPAASRATWVVRLLVTGIALDVLALFSGLGHASLLSQAADGVTVAAADRNASDLRQAAVALLQLIVFVATAVIFLAWLHRAYGNLAAFASVSGLAPSHTPRATVWWWFVPFLNLVRPFQIVRELWHLSDTSARPGPEPGRGELPTPAVVGWWWGIWLVSSVIGQAVMRVSLQADTPQAQLTSAYLALASDAIAIVAALFTISVVKEIDAKQTASARRLAG